LVKAIFEATEEYIEKYTTWEKKEKQFCRDAPENGDRIQVIPSMRMR